MPTLTQVIRTIFVLVVAAAIFFLLRWMLGALAIPDPFGYLAHGVLIVGAVFVCIGVLLELLGYPVFKR